MSKKCTPKPQDQSRVFKEDYRKSNAALHLLYTKSAVKHLRLLDRILLDLNNMANLNMLDTQMAV